MPSAQTVAPTSRAKRTNDSTSAIRAGSRWMSGIRARSSLTMSGRTRISCLSPAWPAPASSIAIRAPRSRRSATAAASESSSGTNSCSVISIDDPFEVSPQARRWTRSEESAEGLTLIARWVSNGRPSGSSAARIAAASSSAPRPQPCAWANQTSGRAPALARKPRQRLVADHAPAAEADHRLEHADDRPVEAEQLLDLGPLALGPGRRRVLGVEAAGAPLAAALGPVEGAVGELVRASTGPRRRRGRRRRRPSS